MKTHHACRNLSNDQPDVGIAGLRISFTGDISHEIIAVTLRKWLALTIAHRPNVHIPCNILNILVQGKYYDMVIADYSTCHSYALPNARVTAAKRTST